MLPLQPSNSVIMFQNVLFALVFSFVDTKSLRWELVTFKQSIFNKVCNRALLFVNLCQSQSAQALKGKACIKRSASRYSFSTLLFSGCAWSCSLGGSTIFYFAIARTYPLFQSWEIPNRNLFQRNGLCHVTKKDTSGKFWFLGSLNLEWNNSSNFRSQYFSDL